MPIINIALDLQVVNFLQSCTGEMFDKVVSRFDGEIVLSKYRQERIFWLFPRYIQERFAWLNIRRWQMKVYGKDNMEEKFDKQINIILASNERNDFCLADWGI